MKLKDLTISNYKEIGELIHSDKDEVQKNVDLIAYLNGVDPNEITLDYLKKHANDSTFLNEVPPLVKKFTLKGRRFKVILDARQIKFGKYIDVMNTLKDKTSELEIIRNMEKFMALLCIERTRFKKHLSYEELCEFFNNHLTMDIVLPTSLFFSRVLTALTPHILDYLEETVKQVSSQAIGDGSSQ